LRKSPRMRYSEDRSHGCARENEKEVREAVAFSMASWTDWSDSLNSRMSTPKAAYSASVRS
jgi:hypothetical protein